MGSSAEIVTMKDWRNALLFALAYAALATLSLATMQKADGIAVVWPSSGVFLAGLMLLPSRTRFVFAAMIATASMASNMAFGTPWWMAAGFTAANLAEGGIAATIALSGNRAWGRLDDPVWVVRLFCGSILAAFVSAGIATLSAGDASGPMFFGSWFTTVLLGLLIVAPAIVTLYRGRFTDLFEGDTLLRALAVFAAGSASIAVTFFQTSYPLLFLPLAFTVLATYLLGAAGAVGMLLLVTVGGTIGIMHGLGPVGFDSDSVGSIYFFQLYLLIVFVSALPLATLLEKSRRQAEELTRRNTLLETAEAFAQVGHWRFDLATEQIEWSDEMFRIYGLDPSLDTPRDLAGGAIVPEEAELVRAALRGAVATGEPFDHKLLIRHANGTLRNVHARGYVESSADRPRAIFGVLRDITDQANAMEELHRARSRAEREAQHALLLSETDQLTGVANRRKLLTVLGREMEVAEQGGSDLAIVMIDVDHFKAINDTHGHAIGDFVLQRIAEAGRGCLRDQDLFGRLGGEEFLVILPGADESLATKVGERLRETVHDLSDDRSVGLEKVTISLGVAVYQAGADVNFLLQAADGALYKSKADGRNRLSVASAA